MRNYPTQKQLQAINRELGKLLPKVFGKEILSDTEYMKIWRAGGSEMRTVKNSAWYLYYTGDVAHFQSNLPKARAREIAAAIQRYIRYSDGYEKKKDQLPKPEELIDDYLTIHVEPLRAFARAGISLVTRSGFSPIQWVMNTALEHEKDWYNFEDHIISEAARLILGRTEDLTKVTDKSFRTEMRYRDDPSMYQLYFLVDDPIGLKRHPEVDKDLQPWQFARKGEDIFNRRAKELGIDHLFKYEFFHEGTHAPRDELRLIMNALSTEGMVVKLAEVAKPDTLANVQTFFREVIREMSPGHYIHHHPREFWEDLEKLVPHPSERKQKEKTDYKPWFDAREKGVEKLLAENPKYAAWQELAVFFTEDNKTIGDMLKVLRNPPPDKDTIYNEMKAYLYKILPLLAAEFEEPVKPATSPTSASAPDAQAG